MLFDLVTRLFSPYQLNPFNYNPLRQVLTETVDFERAAFRSLSGQTLPLGHQCSHRQDQGLRERRDRTRRSARVSLLCR